MGKETCIQTDILKKISIVHQIYFSCILESTLYIVGSLDFFNDSFTCKADLCTVCAQACMLSSHRGQLPVRVLPIYLRKLSTVPMITGSFW